MRHPFFPKTTRTAWHRRLAGLALCGVLAGCATGPEVHPRDPLEPWNRQVYGFNQALDRAVLKPVAETYVAHMPQPVRVGVGNFFANWGDLWSGLNAGLQGQPRQAAENWLRFGINSTFGLLGVLDVASEAGLPRSRFDFGSTLGRWGLGSGPYLMLPVWGPSTLREGVALSLDRQADPVNGLSDVPTRNALTGLGLLDKRAALLGVESVLDAAALDPYAFLRDAYLQRRDALAGVTPPEERYDLD